MPNDPTTAKGGGLIRAKPRYQIFTAAKLAELPAIRELGGDWVDGMMAAATVLPTKVSSYAVEELIDWNDLPDDPIFTSLVPQPNMLLPEQRARMTDALASGDPERIQRAATNTRHEMGPHPAAQMSFIPEAPSGEAIEGMQHKYAETALLFPRNGQTCHSYCTFCFRFPQFTATRDGLHRFATQDLAPVYTYLREHRGITDVLVTGGDSMIMRTQVLRSYLEPILSDDMSHIRSIRFGTRALSFWPYRFLTDPDSRELLDLFRDIVASGRHAALMAHLLHPRELETDAAQAAVESIRATGANIRSQAPVLRHINDAPELWAANWRRQVRLGIVPYYMFVARDTGPHHFFAVPLLRSWRIFSEAARQVSGLGRTVRGPCMSTEYGKIEILGPTRVAQRNVLALRMIQGRERGWAYRPFFAELDSSACWIDELEPAFGDSRFYFQEEMGAPGLVPGAGSNGGPRLPHRTRAPLTHPARLLPYGIRSERRSSDPR